MRPWPALAFLLLLLCASAASADEQTIRLLGLRAEEYMEHLDKKEFAAIREMLDPEVIRNIPEDIFLKTMTALYGEVTIFYSKPKVEIISADSGKTSFKITYFSKGDVGVGCQRIYWALRKGRWFVSYHGPGLLDGTDCVF